VIISVSGGVADIIFKPRGVAVSLFDYDVEGETDVPRDPDGEPCSIRRWPAPELVLFNEHWPLVKQAPRSIRTDCTRKWKCPDCGHIVRCNYEELAEAGSPYCPTCDREMQLT
jgi:hypothetical protein